MSLFLFGCLAAGGAACADGLFSPPVGPAMPAGVGSPGQPIVGRFGVFAPPPLAAAPRPVAAYDPPRAYVEPKQGAKKSNEPQTPPLPLVELYPHDATPGVGTVTCDTGDFSADAWFAPYDACAERAIYAGKKEVPVQRPLVELGLPFYSDGPLPRGGEALGKTNLTLQKFYVYGDYRLGFTQANLAAGEDTTVAHRLNLELDYWLTSTERFHAFVGPFQEDARFMRVTDGKYFEELDLFQADTDTLFFEGDVGQMLGGATGQYAPFDLPVTAGLVPLLFQNGVWMFDAIVGGAVTIPAQNHPGLDWSNYDVTFFGGFNRVSSGAFGFDENAAAVVGATTFIESRGGYLEVGYAYLDDRENQDRSYHNLGVSYTRRYANLVSNSVRVIVNAGQDRRGAQQTADGVLLIVENSLLSASPYNVVPYLNFFAGFDRPQPVARAGAFGGTLFNTGILFQIDQLTNYPTLDSSANNTYGVAIGVDLLAPGFDQQLLLEMAALGVMESRSERVAAGNQVGVAMRWQKQLSYATLVRADAMVGLLDNSDDIAGARIEYRWKF